MNNITRSVYPGEVPSVLSFPEKNVELFRWSLQLGGAAIFSVGKTLIQICQHNSNDFLWIL
jgi:hypothetical protein